MTSIVFLDAATYGDVSLEPFASQWDCTIYPVTSPTDLRGRLKGQSVAVTNKVTMDRAALGAIEARDLKLIAVAATGTDIIDKQAAKESGIKVCNVPGYATQSVAQFTFALILELATRVGAYCHAVTAGKWQRSPTFTLLDYPAVELNGKTLGIIGYGNIGRAVAEMARGFGLKPLISARPGSADLVPAGRNSLEQVFRESDILTLHCPLTPQTQHLVSEQSLSWMKPGAFLVNTARGGLIDEAALLRALREKRLAGAALDVISSEPPPADHPVLKAVMELDNLLVTPHTAWSAREARERLLGEVAENVRAFLGGFPRNIVT